MPGNDLLIHASVWVTCGLCVLAALRLLIRPRRAGVWPCAGCGYELADLVGSGVTNCPESGHDIDASRRPRWLGRTRWRLGVALIAIGAVVHLWLHPAAERRDEGWTALVPTTGLIIAQRWAPRYDRTQVTAQQQRLLRV